MYHPMTCFCLRCHRRNHLEPKLCSSVAIFLLLSLSTSYQANAHPGTWRGRTIMNENGAPLPDLTGLWKWKGSDSNRKSTSMRTTTIMTTVRLKIYQPIHEAAAMPNSTYAVLRDVFVSGVDSKSIDINEKGEQEFLGVCRLRAVYDYETRARKVTTIVCEKDGHASKERGMEFFWGNPGHIVISPNVTHDENGISGENCDSCQLHIVFPTLSSNLVRMDEPERDEHQMPFSLLAKKQTKFSTTLVRVPEPQTPLTSGRYTGVANTNGGATGSSRRKVHTVHVVFMNHYDVGYTDYINGVDNTYMHKYFAFAETTAKAMRRRWEISTRRTKDSFVYTTHPWLMYRFLTCPCPPKDYTSFASSSVSPSSCNQDVLSLSLNNTFEHPLSCPNSTELRRFEEAVRRGDIVWNGAPFNLQTENMSPELLDAGINLASVMDRRFRGVSNEVENNTTRTLSIRDVMYITRSTLSISKIRGTLKYVTIGSNGAGYPPQLPKLHVWAGTALGEGEDDVIVAYHPYGYGGYGLKDCAESPDGVALCTEFRTDNTGPPQNVSEVENVLTSVRKTYPDAKVLTSTFDNFFRHVESEKEDLPRLSPMTEVGDTWIYGAASDPLKMRQHRAIQRVWIETCFDKVDENTQDPYEMWNMKPKLCGEVNHPVVQNFTFFLLKTPEHTWGNPVIPRFKAKQYDREVFWRDYNSSVVLDRGNKTSLSSKIEAKTIPGYVDACASWAEQRLFNELAVRSLEETVGVENIEERKAFRHLAKAIREELEVVENIDANAKIGRIVSGEGGWEEIPVHVENQVILHFVNSESNPIHMVVDVKESAIYLKSLNSNSSFKGRVVYRVFNDTEWKPFSYSYMNDRQMQRGFTKVGSNPHSESSTFRATVKRVFVRGGKTKGGGREHTLPLPPIIEVSHVAVELVFPPRARKRYGAPRRVMLEVDRRQSSNQKRNRDHPEAVRFSYLFEDKLATMVGESLSIVFEDTTSKWSLSKLGREIDPENVLDGGNQYNHAVWGPVLAWPRQKEKGAGNYMAGGGALELSRPRYWIDSLDVPVVNPLIDGKYTEGNPLPASTLPEDSHSGKGLAPLRRGSVFGMAFNVHNNLWNTNYPLFYPYYDPSRCALNDDLTGLSFRCKDRDILARFEVRFGDKEKNVDDELEDILVMGNDNEMITAASQ